MRYDVKLIGKTAEGVECEAIVSVYASEDGSDLNAKVQESLDIAVWFEKKPGWPDVPEGTVVTFERAEAIEQPPRYKGVMGIPTGFGGFLGDLFPPQEEE